MKRIKIMPAILLISVITLMPAGNVYAVQPDLFDEEMSYVSSVKQAYYNVYEVSSEGDSVTAVNSSGEKETENRTIYISSADEFLAFAENCVLDSYSADLIVNLEEDIDLTGKDFDGIPWFQGIFEGNSHRISGISISRSGTNSGLFRTIGEKGIVKNLRVEGSVAAAGTAENVGGIAGENFGNIIGCSFCGKVEGLTKAGGIAGINGESGVITSSDFEGTVQGEHQTGGIAGENLGTVALSKNAGKINTEAVVVSSEKTENLINSIISDVTDISAEDILDVTDTGGIAGFSSGVIYECDNSGTVGYQHIGYNTGGICGRTSGYISACTSSGSVYGKNDVGGIAGQLEPDTAWDLSDSNITKLKDSFSKFEDSMNILVNNISSSAAEITESASSLITSANSTQTAFRKVLESAAVYTGNIVTFLQRTIDNITEENAKEELKKLVQELKDLAPDTSELTESIAETISAANKFKETVSGDRNLYENAVSVIDSLNDIINTGINTSESLGLSEDYINDISVREAYNEDRGAVDSCISTADVNGDSCIGGIAGSVDFEISFDVENELGLSEYIFGNAKYQIFSVIRDCKFSGDISVKKEKSGGICGSELFGLIINSSSRGAINSDDAGYIGGIAGCSEAAVISCYSGMDLYGKSYIGGICGKGMNISSSLSYSFIKEGEEILGSICGDATGTVENNTYIEGGYGGIDGVDFEGKTKAITYAEMCDDENVPNEFKSIQVTFEKEGETEAVVSVNYGGRVESIPDVSPEDGKFWKWDDFENENIRKSFTVKGSWQNPVTTIATDEELPLFLAEGYFDESQELIVTGPEGSGIIASETGNAEQSALSVEEGRYKLEITGFEGSALVRIRGNNLEIYRIDETGMVKMEVAEDGSYSLINVELPCTIEICREQEQKSWIFIVAAAAAAVAVIIILIIIRNKRKHSQCTAKTE